MNSFKQIVKRHGVIIWLCHVMASLLIMGSMVVLFLAGWAVAAGIAGGSVFDLNPDDLMNRLQETGAMARAIGSGLIMTLVYLLVSSVCSAGQIAVVKEAITKDKISIKTFFTHGIKNMWRMLGLGILSGLFYLPAGLIAWGGVYLFTINFPGLGFLCVFLAGVAFLYSMVGLLFAQYILVVEEVPIWESIRSSFVLLKKETGHVVITFLSLCGLGLLVFFFVMMTMGDHGLLFYLIYNLVISTVAAAITLIVLYRYYRYLRDAIYPAVEKGLESGNDVHDIMMDKTEE